MTRFDEHRRSITAGAVAGLAFTAAVGLVWLGIGNLLAAPSQLFGGSLVAVSDAPQAASPASTTIDGRDGLEIRVTLPGALVLDQPVALDLTVVDTSGARLDPDTLLAVVLEPHLTDPSTGWVSISPLQRLGRAGALDPLRVELHAFGELRCSDTIGTLTITVRELAEGGRTGVEEVALPGTDCASQAPPPAPAEIHITEVVCRDEDWADLEDRLIDNEVVYHADCNPPPPPRRSPPPEPEPDEEPEPEPDTAEAEPEPTTEDGSEGGSEGAGTTATTDGGGSGTNDNGRGNDG